ncbi:predicted protein [Sclerotinia sclerotiorum 1980 UF-70]|uniref:Uncharacterized protein n=1 Tax=Sclerotinia sclerotiorum (strain ATCC 18683 / 1980 / Ss-1) TaxID=665079 RepID=A7ESA1_SCLS1|nr:predicted protein [Sclerotinia sclerotiorum 1980 UF-70]EDN92343.1 predicted protein [Sclerotinia sclerotiorum 1980 UF-70]
MSNLEFGREKWRAGVGRGKWEEGGGYLDREGGRESMSIIMSNIDNPVDPFHQEVGVRNRT